MTRSSRTLLASAFAVALLAATAAPAMAGDAAATHGSVIGDWKTRTDGVKQTVTFDSDGTVYGDSGCNRFTGGYTISDGRIKIGPLASTMMFCEGKMDAEAAFLKTLQGATSFHATDAKLTLTGKAGSLTLKAA